jgi:hypothetical protein
LIYVISGVANRRYRKMPKAIHFLGFAWSLLYLT